MTARYEFNDHTIVPVEVLKAINTIFEPKLLESERGDEYYFIPHPGMTSELIMEGLNFINDFIPLNIEPQLLVDGQCGYRIISLENHLRACEFIILLNKQKLNNMLETIQSQGKDPASSQLRTNNQEIPQPDIQNQNIDPEEAFYGGNKEAFLKTLAHYFKVVSVPTQTGEETLFLAPKTKLLPITSQEGKAAQDMLNNAYYAIEGQPHPQFGRLYYTSRPECIEAFKKVVTDLNDFINNPTTQDIINQPIQTKSILTAADRSKRLPLQDPLRKLKIPGINR